MRAHSIGRTLGRLVVAAVLAVGASATLATAAAAGELGAPAVVETAPVVTPDDFSWN